MHVYGGALIVKNWSISKQKLNIYYRECVSFIAYYMVII